MKTATFKAIFGAFMFCALTTVLLMAAGAQTTGSGTQDDPYIVDTYSDFVSRLTSGSSSETLYIRLGADIKGNNRSISPSSDAIIDLCGYTINMQNVSAHIKGDGRTIAVKNGNVVTKMAFFNSAGNSAANYILEDLDVITSNESCIWINKGTVTAENCSFTSSGASPIAVSYAETSYIFSGCTLMGPESESAYTYSAGRLMLDGRNIAESSLTNRYSPSFFENINISLGRDIKINYYVAKRGLKAPEMKFTVNGYTKTVGGESVGEQYKFTFDGVAPHWIGDTVTAELTDGGSTVEVKEYSVLKYLRTLSLKTSVELGMSEEKYSAMQVLINDLLVYAGAAQKYTGHKVDDAVSDGVNGTEFVAVTETDKSSSGTEELRFTSATVYFDSVNKLAFKFKASDIIGLTVKLKVNGGAESEVGYTDNGDGTYLVLTDAVYATGFDDVYTLTLYKEGKSEAYVTYSVRSYVYSKQNGADKLAELVKATYNYGLAAKRYDNIAV